MSNHTPGPWRSGKWGASIVCDTPIQGGINGSDAVESYGGHLIAESISACNQPLIIAAPDLLSIAQRWLALDSQWHPERYASEKEQLLSDTKEILARATQ